MSLSSHVAFGDMLLMICNKLGSSLLLMPLWPSECGSFGGEGHFAIMRRNLSAL